MKKLIAFIAIMIVLIAGLGWAAPTVTESGSTVEISEIDADFTYTTSCMLYGRDGNGAKINFIHMIAGTEAEYVVIKNGSDSGPTIFYSMDSTHTGTTRPVYYHGVRLRPVLDFNVSSVSHDGTKVIIQLWPQQ